MSCIQHQCDVLVIGGGVAACFAAIKAAEAGASVIMADKGYVGRSGQSPYADGFMIFNPEWGHDMDKTMETLNRHSEYLNNRDWTRIALENSYARYQDLLAWGCEFQTKPDGRPELRTDGGAYMPTAAQFSKAHGGYGDVLRRQAVKVGVQILDQTMIVELLKQNGRIVGAVGLPNDSTELVVIAAKAAISCVGHAATSPRVIRRSCSLPATARPWRTGRARIYWEKNLWTPITARMACPILSASAPPGDPPPLHRAEKVPMAPVRQMAGRSCEPTPWVM